MASLWHISCAATEREREKISPNRTFFTALFVLFVCLYCCCCCSREVSSFEDMLYIHTQVE